MKKILIFFVNAYQRHVSTYLQSKGINCKFYPSCSEYMKQAIEKYGSVKGVFLAVWRILRCNPFSKGGFDPLK